MNIELTEEEQKALQLIAKVYAALEQPELEKIDSALVAGQMLDVCDKLAIKLMKL